MHDGNHLNNELKKKLTEEVTEFTNSDDVIELCDLIEVISAILDYKNINNKEFEENYTKEILEQEYFLLEKH
mgnify:CR=1 FL=1